MGMVVMRNILCYDIMWIYLLIHQNKMGFEQASEESFQL